MREALALATILLAFSSAVKAQDTAAWGQVGGWKIMVDRSVGDGCFALQPYADGTTLRMGVDRENGALYFLFGNDAWKSIEIGKKYRLRFVFDGTNPYDGELTASQIGKGATVLVHRNISKAFLNDFAQRNTMEIYYRDSRIAFLSLRNTMAAMSEVANCQNEFGFTKKASDPFSNGRANPDPFR